MAGVVRVVPEQWNQTHSLITFHLTENKSEYQKSWFWTLVLLGSGTSSQEHFKDLIFSSMYLNSGESASTIHLCQQIINMGQNLK